MDIFRLYRNFWDFAFENPDLIKPNHIAIFAFSVEHCNRLGWKKKFGLPTSMTMEAVGIKSYNTYISAFNDLVKLGVFELHEKSKNQYSSNIIALSYFDKAPDKALDKAFIKHLIKQTSKQVESTQQSNSSIDIQYTNKDYNKEDMSDSGDNPESNIPNVDYPNLFKKYIDYYNKAFSKNFTTKGWEKKAYSKFKQAHSSYKENFGKHLVIVCDNIKKDDFHKEKEFKFATPEYILRPEVFERFLNAKPQVQKWNKPSEIFMCVDWIKRIPQPPKVDTPEYYRFIEEWKISDLKSYQVNKTGSYTNLDEYGK